MSNLHLGARDPDAGGFAMIGKTFKGLTDELLAWQTRELGARVTHEEDGYVVHVRPELVVEVAFNDVQVRPRYASGFALRFARVKRYRSDKTAAEPTRSLPCGASRSPYDGRRPLDGGLSASCLTTPG